MNVDYILNPTALVFNPKNDSMKSITVTTRKGSNRGTIKLKLNPQSREVTTKLINTATVMMIEENDGT